MYYTIYKITNKLNGKYYIGKHQTKDLNDGYMGSGKLVKRAIEKYGIENFTKEILHIFESETEMNAKEKELVIISEDTYNLCEGGKGGFSYINKNRLFDTKKHSEAAKNNLKLATKKFVELNKNNFEWRQEWIAAIKRNSPSAKEGYINPFYGKRHSVEAKNKISEKNSISQKGHKNSQFNTCWITNGIENKKIKKDIDILPEGWYKGRTIKLIL